MAETLKPNLGKLNLEQLENLRINPEDMAKVENKEDRDFLYLNGAVTYLNGMNLLDRTIRDIANQVRALIPAPLEELKIIISRLEDIDPKEIDDLSSVFIDNLFTIEGKEVKITMPEVGDFDKLEFRRMLIRNIKMIDEQSTVIVACKKKIQANFENDIPDYIKEIVSDATKLDQYFVTYFEHKAQDQTLTKEQREEYQKKLEYRGYAKNLKPLIDKVKEITDKKNGTDSILHGFLHDRLRVLNAAVEIAHANKFTFPFQTLTGLDEKLFGDKFSKYKNILTYLIANYIRHKRTNITQFDKIFLTDMFTNLILINRPDAEDKYKNLMDEMKPHIEELLSLSTGIQ